MPPMHEPEPLTFISLIAFIEWILRQSQLCERVMQEEWEIDSDKKYYYCVYLYDHLQHSFLLIFCNVFLSFLSLNYEIFA